MAEPHPHVRDHTRAANLRRAKFIAFSMIPALLLITLAETSVRLLGLDRPSLFGPTFVGEQAGLHEDDEELFWRLRPGVRIRFQEVEVATNALGLRSAEIAPKRPNEFRVLSLGESTTFGARVEAAATYSSRLEVRLNHRRDGLDYRVINAGVSAYSSFQSLKYLQTRGLSLEPDLVLFYHEYNDYLPSSVRDGGVNEETELALTDRQVFESREQVWHRKLQSYSAIYRFIRYRAALQRIESFQRGEGAGLLQRGAVADEREDFRDLRLPPRVSVAERVSNLGELAVFCHDHGIALVIIHPSYAGMRRHECELTRFCRERDVPMFEAYDSLHFSQAPDSQLFADAVHPTALGHEQLASDLCRFLAEAGLLGGD